MLLLRILLSIPLFYAWSNASFYFFSGVIVLTWLGIGIMLVAWCARSKRMQKIGAITLMVGLCGLALGLPMFLEHSFLLKRG